AIYKQSGTFPVTNNANLQSAGGYAGGPGTIYIDDDGLAGGNGELIVDNFGNNWRSAGLPIDYSPYLFSKITLRGYGHLRVVGSTSEIIIPNDSNVVGDSTKPRLEPEGIVTLPSTYTLSTYTLDIIGDYTGADDLILGDGTNTSELRLYARTQKRQ